MRRQAVPDLSIGHAELCIPPLGRLLPCDQKLCQFRRPASHRSKRRIPKVESATAPRNPWILGRVDDLRAADAAKPNNRGIRNGHRLNGGKLIGSGPVRFRRRTASRRALCACAFPRDTQACRSGDGPGSRTRGGDGWGGPRGRRPSTPGTPFRPGRIRTRQISRQNFEVQLPFLGWNRTYTACTRIVTTQSRRR